MKINDETLSAFIDAELPEAEMETIRQQLANDEALSDRLSELMTVDKNIVNHYNKIDEQPLPKAVTDLFESASEKNGQGKVVQFPVWKRVQTQMQKHSSLAAAIALAIGFGLAQVIPAGDKADQQWQLVSAGLETLGSGSAYELENGQTLISRLTFLNSQGQYCRQFQLSDADSQSENIACRSQQANEWQLTASIELNAVQQSGEYQTASGGSLLDNALDLMMASDALNAEAEQALISSQWNKPE